MRLMFQGCPPGNDVRTIQNRLNQAARRHVKQLSSFPPLVPDGIFGKKTGDRVVEFQAKNGLVVDGVIGRQTEGTLNVLLGNPTQLTPEHVPPSQKKAAQESDGSSSSSSSKTSAKMPSSGSKTGPKMGGGGTEQKTAAKMGAPPNPFGAPPVPGMIPGAVFPTGTGGKILGA
jgi:peptidoglycan hydrolase-like protein with peptidoglycan-binding domain